MADKDGAVLEIPAGSTACLICEEPKVGFRWTDTHGVAQCSKCGAPYRVYHYVDDKRVERQPELQIKPELVEAIKGYYKTTRRKIPGGFSFSQDYEVASPEDAEEFYGWLAARGKGEGNPDAL